MAISVYMIRRIVFSCFVLIPLSVYAQEENTPRWQEVPAIARLFTQAGVFGTFAVYDSKTNTLSGTNHPRAVTRYSPASTFKIPNALIGLSVGAVKDVNEPIPYRSNDPPFNPAWVRNMGLHDAILLSNVPIYQELARRIGRARMQEALERLQYGSRRIGVDVDRFWLDGSLVISAAEQIQFIGRLAEGTLPYPIQAQRQVWDITVVTKTPTMVVHAKTGWQNAPNAGVGWWVGWIERNGMIYPFALNIDIQSAADAALRQTIGLTALRILHIID